MSKLDGTIFFNTYVLNTVLKPEDLSPEIINGTINFWNIFFNHLQKKISIESTIEPIPISCPPLMNAGTINSKLKCKLDDTSDGQGLLNSGQEFSNQTPVPSDGMAKTFNLLFEYINKSAYITVTNVEVSGTVATPSGPINYSGRSITPIICNLK